MAMKRSLSTPPRSSPHNASHCRRPRLPLAATLAVCTKGALPLPEPLASAISSFVTDAHWTIENASALGDLRLLQRVIALEASSTHPLYRAHTFRRALVCAVKHEDEHALELLACLQAYCPTGDAVPGLTEAACLGKVRVMEWLVQHFGDIVWRPVFVRAAAANGQLQALKWLKNRFPDDEHDWGSAMPSASTGGHLEIVQWLYESMPHVSWPALESGMMPSWHKLDKQDLRRAKRLLEHGYMHVGLAKPVDGALALFWNEKLTLWLQTEFYKAAASGRVESVRWLLEHSPRVLQYNHAFLLAVEKGHLDVAHLLRRLVLGGYSYDHALHCAVRNGRVETVEWLVSNLRRGFAFSDTILAAAIDRAAASGHFDIVKQIHALRNGPGRLRYSLLDAVCSGHFEIVKWLVEHGDHVPQNQESDYLRFAASSGNLELLVWVQARWGSTVTDEDYADAMAAAAEKGHLNIVQWLHEHHRAESATEWTMDSAAMEGHLRVVQWLHDNRREDGCTADAMNLAAQSGHLDVVRWLHENRSEGCTTDAMDEAGSLDMVEWLHANRSEGCTTNAMDYAAERGDVDTLVFLHENRSEGCTVFAAAAALSKDHMAIFQWLVENYPDIMQREAIREALGDETGIFPSSFFDKLESAKRQRIE